MDEILRQKLVAVVKDLTDQMGIPCDVQAQESDAASPVAITLNAGEDSRFLIGKNGQNLMALEHIARMMWSRQHAGNIQLALDVNDYRKLQRRQLLDVVAQTATRVRDTRTSEALPPMTPYERRVVHTELASWADISTESIGQDPQRRVVIKPL